MAIHDAQYFFYKGDGAHRDFISMLSMIFVFVWPLVSISTLLCHFKPGQASIDNIDKMIQFSTLDARK